MWQTIGLGLLGSTEVFNVKKESNLSLVKLRSANTLKILF